MLGRGFQEKVLGKIGCRLHLLMLSYPMSKRLKITDESEHKDRNIDLFVPLRTF
jgi:hypothetical protein